MMNLITDKLFLACGAVVLLLAFSGGWKVRDWQADAAEAAAMKNHVAALIRQKEEFDRLLAGRDAEVKRLSARIADLRKKQSAAQPEAAREYAKPVYTACVVPADGVRILNAAVDAANEAAAVP